jgi:hypothetical protein
MNICVGYVRARYAASAWKPCGKRALAGEALCASHRDALDSALLGIMDLEQRACAEKAGAKRRRTRVGHAKRRGGKPRRPSGSNRTRPSRVPLPVVKDGAGNGEVTIHGESKSSEEFGGGEKTNSGFQGKFGGRSESDDVGINGQRRGQSEAGSGGRI